MVKTAPNSTPIAPKKQGGFFAFLAGLFRRKPKNDWMNTINQGGSGATANEDFVNMNNVGGNRQS